MSTETFQFNHRQPGRPLNIFPTSFTVPDPKNSHKSNGGYNAHRLIRREYTTFTQFHPSNLSESAVPFFCLFDARGFLFGWFNMLAAHLL